MSLAVFDHHMQLSPGVTVELGNKVSSEAGPQVLEYVGDHRFSAFWLRSSVKYPGG